MGLSLSTCGSQATSCGADGSVVLLDLFTKTCERCPLQDTLLCVSWRPGTKYSEVAVGTEKGEVKRVWKRLFGMVGMKTVYCGDIPVSAIDWSPDGQKICFATNYGAYVYNDKHERVCIISFPCDASIKCIPLLHWKNSDLVYVGRGKQIYWLSTNGAHERKSLEFKDN
eukprot:UN24738